MVIPELKDEDRKEENLPHYRRQEAGGRLEGKFVA